MNKHTNWIHMYIAMNKGYDCNLIFCDRSCRSYNNHIKAHYSAYGS